MRRPEELRQTITAYAFLFFLVPVLAYTAYGSTRLSWGDSWWLFFVGLLIAVAGTFFLTVQMWRWHEEEHQDRLDYDTTLPVIPPPLDEEEDWVESTSSHDEETFHLQHTVETLERGQSQLRTELDQRLRDLEQQRKLNDSLEQQLGKMQDEMRQLRESSRLALHDRETTLKVSDDTMQDFHQALEKKDRYILELENIVADLRYEIKTLLNVNVSNISGQPKNESKRQSASLSSAGKDKPMAQQKDLFSDLSFTSQSSSESMATQQLHRCIEIAQKLTGVSPFETSSRFRDLEVGGGFALDQRRLFDSLGSETSGIVFVYSKRDNKILFSNNQCKTILGWSSDKFIHDFMSVMSEQAEVWKKAVYSISPLKTVIQVSLRFKKKEGGEQLLSCHLGLIPTGLFKGNIVGVMHPQVAQQVFS